MFAEHQRSFPRGDEQTVGVALLCSDCGALVALNVHRPQRMSRQACRCGRTTPATFHAQGRVVQVDGIVCGGCGESLFYPPDRRPAGDARCDGGGRHDPEPSFVYRF